MTSSQYREEEVSVAFYYRRCKLDRGNFCAMRGGNYFELYRRIRSWYIKGMWHAGCRATVRVSCKDVTQSERGEPTDCSITRRSWPMVDQ